VRVHHLAVKSPAVLSLPAFGLIERERRLGMDSPEQRQITEIVLAGVIVQLQTYPREAMTGPFCAWQLPG